MLNLQYLQSMGVLGSRERERGGEGGGGGRAEGPCYCDSNHKI